MSLIPCTCSCRYQQDGCCTLERAVTGSLPIASGKNSCANFVPRLPSDQHRQSVPNGSDRNQLESLRSGEFSAVSGWDQALGESQTPDLR